MSELASAYHLDADFNLSWAVRRAVGAMRTLMRHKDTGHEIIISTIANHPKYISGLGYELIAFNHGWVDADAEDIFDYQFSGSAEYDNVDGISFCYEDRSNTPIAMHIKAERAFAEKGYEFCAFARKNMDEWITYKDASANVA